MSLKNVSLPEHTWNQLTRMLDGTIGTNAGQEYCLPLTPGNHEMVSEFAHHVHSVGLGKDYDQGSVEDELVLAKESGVLRISKPLVDAFVQTSVARNALTH